MASSGFSLTEPAFCWLCDGGDAILLYPTTCAPNPLLLFVQPQREGGTGMCRRQYPPSMPQAGELLSVDRSREDRSVSVLPEGPSRQQRVACGRCSPPLHIDWLKRKAAVQPCLRHVNNTINYNAIMFATHLFAHHTHPEHTSLPKVLAFRSQVEKTCHSSRQDVYGKEL